MAHENHTTPSPESDDDMDQCLGCGGEVRRVAKPGRTRTSRGVVYTLPADLSLLTCLSCGTHWLDGPDTEAIAQAIEAQRAAPTRAAG